MEKNKFALFNILNFPTRSTRVKKFLHLVIPQRVLCHMFRKADVEIGSRGPYRRRTFCFNSVHHVNNTSCPPCSCCCKQSTNIYNFFHGFRILHNQAWVASTSKLLMASFTHAHEGGLGSAAVPITWHWETNFWPNRESKI